MTVRHSSDGGLARFAERLEAVASGAWKADASEAVASEVRALVAEEFATGKDPSGARWPARKSGGSWPLLVRSGRTRASVQVAPGAFGATVTIGGAGDYHQRGTRRLPARRILPDARTSAWDARIGEAAAKALRKALEG